MLSIMGISHFCYGLNELDYKEVIYSDIAYKAKFIESNLKIKDEVRPFLRSKTYDSQGMCFMQHDKYPSVEYLYNAQNKDVSFPPMYSFTDEMNLLVRTNDIEQSIDFWQNTIGMKPVQSKVNQYQLQSLMPTWSFSLQFKEVKDIDILPPCLDDLGVSCVSLLVRNFDGLIKDIDNARFSVVGQPFTTNINNRKVDIVFARGMQNELIEFISLF